MTQKSHGLVVLEIPDGRSWKEADPRQARKRRRHFETDGEIGNDRMDREPREVAAQLRGVLLQEIAGNVDRNVGLYRGRRAEQNARLLARTCTKFEQNAARRKQRSDRRRIIPQQSKLAACRIIFR